MTILYFLVPLMIGVAAGAVMAFVWAVRGGQLDDLDTPPLRILADDAPAWPSPGARRNVAPEPRLPDRS